ASRERVSSLVLGGATTNAWWLPGECGMVVFCKRCGSPVKLENARLADPAYSVKCQQCQRPVAIDSVRPGARTAAPVPGATLAPAGTPTAETAAATAARVAEEH